MITVVYFEFDLYSQIWHNLLEDDRHVFICMTPSVKKKKIFFKKKKKKQLGTIWGRSLLATPWADE
jgi:hypothetical protein